MQIGGLSLRNIRSFESARLDLAPGTTLLVGDVGAGKTSLLYAVEMALFGAAEVDAAYLVRHGRTQAEVAVRLGDATHTYEISRRFRRVKRRGRESFEPEAITLTEDGHATSYSATELRRRVIDLVGFPDNPNPQAHSDLWRWAIYVPQERMREILSADPDERLETVRKALGVERFRIAAENAARLAADLRADARRRREATDRLAHWDDDLARAQAELHDVAQEHDRLGGEVARLTGVHADARNEVADLERAVAAGLADERELEALSREDLADRRAGDEADARLGALRRELATTEEERRAAGRSAETRSVLVARLELIDRERGRLRADLDRAEEMLRAASAEEASWAANARASEELAARRARAAAESQAAIQALDAARAEGPAHEPPAPTPRSLAEIDTALARSRDDDRTSLDRLVRARAELAATDELLRAGVCPTCHQPVRTSEFATHRAEAAEVADAASRARDSALAELEHLEAERKARERYERAHDRWLEVERRRATLAKSVATWDEELRTLAQRAGESGPSGDARATLEAELRRLHDEQRRLRSAWDEAGSERGSVAGEAEKAARAEERATALDRSLDRVRAEILRAEGDAAARLSRATSRAERLHVLHEKTEALPDLRRRTEARREELARLEDRLAALRGQFVRAEARREALHERAALAERGRADRALLLAEATTLDARARWVDEPLRYHLLAMEKDLLAHAQLSFDRAFSRYFGALIDDPGLVARTDARFTPEVSLDGAITPAEALSGGERTSLALAFRLALASTVRSLGTVRLETLLLDEPTDGFSSEQVVRMGELLEELALPQVVIVSHETQLAAIADHVVRVVKVGGRSEIVAGTDLPGPDVGPAGPPPSPTPPTP